MKKTLLATLIMSSVSCAAFAVDTPIDELVVNENIAIGNDGMYAPIDAVGTNVTAAETALTAADTALTNALKTDGSGNAALIALKKDFDTKVKSLEIAHAEYNKAFVKQAEAQADYDANPDSDEAHIALTNANVALENAAADLALKNVAEKESAEKYNSNDLVAAKNKAGLDKSAAIAMQDKANADAHHNDVAARLGALTDEQREKIDADELEGYDADAHLNQATKANADNIDYLNTKVNEGQTASDKVAADVKDNAKSIDDNKKTLAAHDERIQGNTDAIFTNQEAIKMNSQGIAQNHNDIVDLRQDFDRMAKDYRQFKKQTNGAIAGLAAMSNIPSPSNVGSVSVGAGVGYYESENAISVGLGWRVSEQLNVKASVASNTGDYNPIIGAGVAYEF